MDRPAGASETGNIRLRFDNRVRLEFHGPNISSDGGLLFFRELDEVLGLHELAGSVLRDTRTACNRLHSLAGLLRQSIFRRLVGHDDVNDEDRLSLGMSRQSGGQGRNRVGREFNSYWQEHRFSFFKQYICIRRI